MKPCHVSQVTSSLVLLMWGDLAISGDILGSHKCCWGEKLLASSGEKLEMLLGRVPTHRKAPATGGHPDHMGRRRLHANYQFPKAKNRGNSGKSATKRFKKCS